MSFFCKLGSSVVSPQSHMTLISTKEVYVVTGFIGGSLETSFDESCAFLGGVTMCFGRMDYITAVFLNMIPWWFGGFFSGKLLLKALLPVIFFSFLRAATLRFASSSRFPAPVTRPGRRWRAPGPVFPASPAYFAHRSHGAQRQQLALPATLQKISEFFCTYPPPPRLTFLSDDLRLKNIFSAKKKNIALYPLEPQDVDLVPFTHNNSKIRVSLNNLALLFLFFLFFCSETTSFHLTTPPFFPPRWTITHTSEERAE